MKLPGRKPKSKTTVYRLYGKTGKPLYIGVTGDPKRRAAQHKATKVWYPKVATTKSKTYRTRGRAAAAECKAIRRENPQHDIRGRLK